MESIEFKKILFKTAFCVMACDGDIDELEIEEMKKIDSSTSYFNDIDLSNELTSLISSVKSRGKIVVQELFKTLRDNELSMVQELLIIEVALRIINADNKVDENEIKFLNLLRSKLDIANATLIDRFGSIPYLVNMNYDKLNVMDSQKQFIDLMLFPESTRLKEIDFKN
jgi:uncharacterized tellurite resistance protein B-like protein|tara:strand:- start:821 stop:1327 length:507 start_codon:yes stop_codon:yes gene_type:complete